MKKFKFVLILAVVSLFVMSCANINMAPLSNVTGDYFNSDVPMTRTASATSRVWLGIFGPEYYPLVQRVAAENGITRIASVEYTVQPGILGLWLDFTTTITGN